MRVTRQDGLRTQANIWLGIRVSLLLQRPTGYGVRHRNACVPFPSLTANQPVSSPDFLLGFFSSKIAAKIGEADGNRMGNVGWEKLTEIYFAGPLILLIFAGVLTYGAVYIYFM